MTKTIHFYVEIHTHKTRWRWLCVWQGPFHEAEMNFTFFWKSLAFCLSKMWTVTDHTDINLIGGLQPLSSSWPLRQCRQGQHRHGHCSLSESSGVNLWFFSLWQWHLSVWSPGPVQSDWAVYGSAVLWCLWTHQGLGFEWCIRQRNRNRETGRGAERFKVHFSFAVPSGEENERANNNRS